MKILRPYLFALFVLLSPALTTAAEQSADMKEALRLLVESQDMAKHWPTIVENSARTGAAEFEQGALEALERQTGLTPAQQDKARFLIASWSGPIAAEITARQKRRDVSQVVNAMVAAVYPKYFSAAEIRQMAAFYQSSAFHKAVAIELANKGAQRRPPAQQAIETARNNARFSPEEKAAIATFQASAVARKQGQVGQQVSADGAAFLKEAMRSDEQEVVGPYAKRLADELLAIRREQ